MASDINRGTAKLLMYLLDNLTGRQVSRELQVSSLDPGTCVHIANLLILFLFLVYIQYMQCRHGNTAAKKAI